MKETTSIHIYNAPQDFADELVQEARDRNVSVLELLQSAVRFYKHRYPLVAMTFEESIDAYCPDDFTPAEFKEWKADWRVDPGPSWEEE